MGHQRTSVLFTEKISLEEKGLELYYLDYIRGLLFRIYKELR